MWNLKTMLSHLSIFPLIIFRLDLQDTQTVEGSAIAFCAGICMTHLGRVQGVPLIASPSTWVFDHSNTTF